MTHLCTRETLQASDRVAREIKHNIISNTMASCHRDCVETIKTLRIANAILSRWSTVE